MRNSKQFLYESVRAMCFTISIFYLIYFVIANIVTILVPPDDLIDFSLFIFSDNNFFFLIVTVFIIIMIGIFASTKLGVMKLSYPEFKNWRDVSFFLIITYLTTNYLSGMIMPYLKEIPVLDFFKYFILFISLYIFYTHAVIFLTTFSYKHIMGYISNGLTIYKKLKQCKYLEHEKKEIMNKIKESVVGIIIYLCIVIPTTSLITYKIQKNLAYKKSIREKLFIESIKPSKSTHAHKIVIYGYNFGWHLSDRDILMSDSGEIIPNLWNDTKIEVIIPLSVSEGNHWLQVIRSKDPDDKKSPLIRSNKVNYYVISRWEFYPTIYVARNTEEFIKEKIIKRMKRIIFLHELN